MEIATSVLNVEKDNCIKTFYNIETAGTDYFHIDVMDGEFVKDNTVGQMTEYCEYLNTITRVPLDVHLMVKDVLSYIKSFLIFEPRNITFHYEAAQNKEELMEWIKFVKDNNCKVGLSIKPETEVEKIYDLLPYLHTVLTMTVEPGKGGQEIIKSTIDKISTLKKYMNENNLEFDIEADGGINLNNAKELKDAGCDIIVCGTTIIKSENMKETIDKLKNV